MKKLLSILFFILAYNHSWSQALVWAKTFGGNNLRDCRQMKADSLGNIYMAGSFKGIMDADPSATSYNLTSNGDFDFFIIKQDPQGNLIWARSIGGTLIDHAYALAVDPFTQDVYVGGWFAETVDFDPGPGTYNMTPNGSITSNYDGFVLRLNASGSFAWAVQFGGGNNDQVTSLAFEAPSTIYVAGLFLETADLNPGAGVHSVTSLGTRSDYIIKLDTASDFQWASVYSSPIANQIKINSMVADGAGSIYVCGHFDTDIDLDPGPGTYTLTPYSLYNYDIFTMKIDTAGQLIWAHGTGGKGADFNTSISLSNFSDGVYITGHFKDTVDFDPDTSTVYPLISAGAEDIFILKYDLAGNFVYAKRAGGTGADFGNSVAVDPLNGNVIIAGRFEQTADFDPDTAITYNITSAGFTSAYYLRLDSSGTFQSIWTASGTGAFCTARDIAIDSQQHLITSGVHTGLVDFDPAPAVFNMGTGTWQNIFTCKLNPWTTGIHSTENKPLTSIVFPNPAQQQISITMPEQNTGITITDVSGRIVFNTQNENTTSSNEMKINISLWKPGIYFVSLITEEMRYTEKLMVTR